MRPTPSPALYDWRREALAWVAQEIALLNGIAFALHLLGAWLWALSLSVSAAVLLACRIARLVDDLARVEAVNRLDRQMTGDLSDIPEPLPGAHGILESRGSHTQDLLHWRPRGQEGRRAGGALLGPHRERGGATPLRSAGHRREIRALRCKRARATIRPLVGALILMTIYCVARLCEPRG